MALWWIFMLLGCFSLQGSCMLAAQRDVIVELYQTQYTVGESYSTAGSGISVCLHVSGGTNTSINLQFTVSDGTATEGLDYTLIANHTLQPASNALGNDYCIEVVQVCDDSVPENNEVITVLITTDTPHVQWVQNNFTVFIADDDRVSVAFTKNSYTMSEAGEVEVCVETRGVSERGYVPLTMETSTGTATNEDFYITGIQLHGVGNSFQKCMTLAAIDDDLPEDKEYFKMTVSSSDSLVDINQRSSVRIYITDNDPVTFSLVERMYEVMEGGTVTVCLVVGNHDLPRIRFQLIILHLNGNASAQDYILHNLRDFTIGTNSFITTSEICFDVLTTDDHVSEGTETALFQLHLSTDVSWVVLNMPEDPLIEIVIRDNDVIAVEFGLSSYSVTEGLVPYVSFCVMVNGVTSVEPQPMVHVFTNSATAFGGSDFEVDDRQVQLPISSYCHQLRILDDVRAEPEEMFNICIQSQSSLIHIATDCVEVHIIDNDIPEVMWSESQYTVSERENSVEVCAQVIGTLTKEVEVQLSTVDYTAVGFYDYIAEEHTFTFAPSLEQRQCVSIQIRTDGLTENTEAFRVALTQNTTITSLNISHPYTHIYIQDDSNAEGTPCVEGTIFLNSGANNDSYNLVEMCSSSGRWVSVCDSDWSQEDAATVCQQAGYDRYASAKKSLPSLETAAHVFKCGSTETRLSKCLEEQPDNITCHHLAVICANHGLVTASRVPVITGDPQPSSVPRMSRTTSDASFPVVGVVMGVLSALLLVGVVTVIGVVVGAMLWKRKKSKLAMLEHFPDEPSQPLENPVYAVLESPSKTVSTPPANSARSSCQTNGELYSEILPVVSESPGSAIVTLPSFYDIVRPPAALPGPRGVRDSCAEGEVERGGSECDGVTCSKQRQSVEGNVYETLYDPVSCLDEKGDYSTLERRRGYATLEPYTGSGTLRNGLRHGQHMNECEQQEEEEEYAHLHH